MKRLSYELGNSTLLSNVLVRQKKIPHGSFEDNKNLLATYNTMRLVNFELPREMLK